MELKMKHLVVSPLVLCVLIVPEAMAQRSSSPRIQAMVDASQPLPYASSAAAVAAADQANAPGAVPLAPSPGADAAPMASSFGGSEGLWGQYTPPDYEDGLTSVGACCETCGGGANCPDIWTIRNRVTVWQRSKPRGITTTAFGAYVPVTDPNTGTVTQQLQPVATLGTRSSPFDVAPGYGATVRRYWRGAQENSDLSLEGVYFGFNRWWERRAVNASDRIVDNFTFAGFAITYGNLFTPFTQADDAPFTGVAGFDGADHHEFTYESQIHNVEFNLRMARRPRPDRIVLHPNGRWRRQCQPGIYGSSIFGIRYFSLTEDFHFGARGRTDVFDFGGLLYSVNSSGLYDIRTYNDMLGLQVGLEIMYRHCVWGWGAEAKICPVINFAGQRSRLVSSVTDPGDPYGNDTIDEYRFGARDDLALVGDVSVMAYYKLRPNITVRASWDMMWLVGVAMAAEQLQWVRDPAPRVNNNGTIVYQGISLGLEWTR